MLTKSALGVLSDFANPMFSASFDPESGSRADYIEILCTWAALVNDEVNAV